MKKVILSFAVFLTMNLVHAQTLQKALPVDLANTMKAMAADLKKISAQSTNVALNADSAVTSDDFTQLVIHAKTFVPDTIKKLTGDQRVAAQAEYDKQMDQVIDLAKQMTLAFSSNDNAKVADILKQLLQAKKDGHTKFKE